MATSAEVNAPADLYHALLESWNARDSVGFAAFFAQDGHCIGFDGSEMHGRAEIEAELGQIFADHATAAYVTKIRDVRPLTADVVLLRAAAGMVPPGQSDVNPEVNAVQSMVAVRADGDWRVALFQNTPAQYHGRPEAVEALTAELRELL